MNPIVIIVYCIIAIVISFLKFNKKDIFTSGKKVANTKYIKQTQYYISKIREYKRLINIYNVITIVCIFSASILIARPITIKTQGDNKYNRDIILGLDVSKSQADVNIEMVRKFKDMIPSIEGDRIGIVIFNTAPIVLCPLTEDYE